MTDHGNKEEVELMKMTRNSIVALMLGLLVISSASGAELKVHSYFSDNMVLQRDKPAVVTGSATAGANVTVSFAGQSKVAAAANNGQWSVTLDPMPANSKPQTLTVKSTRDSKAATRSNVLVGDVWLFGRQTYVDISLGRTDEGRAAAAKATGNFRAIAIKTVAAKQPQNDLSKDATAGWMQVDGKSALTMSGAAFYLGRDLVAEQAVPIGIVDVNMSHYFSIGWLSSQALADTATRHPEHAKELAWLLPSMKERAEARDSGKAQADLDAYYEGRGGKGVKPSLGLHPLRNPMYPSAGYNAVIHPLRHVALKGILLQLGNDYPFIAYRDLDQAGQATVKAELDAAWGENYMILKTGYRITPATLPYVCRDWRETMGDKTLPIGLILPPGSDLDVYAAHNREVREMHRRTSEREDAVGLIMPGSENIPSSGQPADDKLLAERCRQWALSAAGGQEGVVGSGPLLERVDAILSKATLHFQAGTADGLKAIGDALDGFETAGPDRVFTPATASIDGATITLKSSGPILFVRYNWREKPDQGLVNRAGLPALPFSTDADWEFAWIPPPEQPNLPEEYSKTANKWSKSDIAIINGQIASMAVGDSEPIPRRPGPLGIVSAPFGPNIYVISIEPETPAVGKLLPGDVIYGVNGKVFDDGPEATTDQVYRDLADAITYSESDDGEGKLALALRRGTKTMEVDLQLKVLGSYSATTPYYCEKSAAIVIGAEAWMSARYRPESGLVSEPVGMLNTDLLFLLASGTPEHQGLVRRAVYGMMEKMDPQPVTQETQSKPWNTGYSSLLLGEYYHATGDRNVLPYLKYQALLSAASQLKPRAETPSTKEASQGETTIGGWRQNYPSNPLRWQSGYGLMPHAGMTCVMGMQLAKEAGLEIDELALERGLEHHNKGRAEYGSVVYSYGGGLRDGPAPINPDAEAKGHLWSMNGKLGTAAALYNMVDNKVSTEACARYCTYGFNRTRSGHGGMFFNNFWTPVGAWAGGEPAFKHFMKGQTWWRELFRRHDGSFNQVGRGRIGVSYALAYVAPKRRLRMLDAPQSAFGPRCPDYLKPAIEAHQKRDYALCESLVLRQLNESITPAEDVPVVKHLLESVQILRASITHDLELTVALIEADKQDYASRELAQLKGVVAADDPRLKAIVAALDSPAGRAKVAAHRKLCEAEKTANEAAKRAAAPSAGPKETWLSLIATPQRGKTSESTWQMKVVEHISHAPEGWTKPKFNDQSWNKATLPISWTMYHTALFRGAFDLEDKDAIDAIRVQGDFFQQANVVVHLNGKLVAKVDNLGRGGGTTDIRLTDYAMTLLKKGPNTVAISSRHKRRWGSFRGTYKTAVTVTFGVEARKSGD
ncbi:MAG: hypothetical protein HN383_13600 [Verrucomicrobia bacterium]|jgi:sialate O-acetylesterase|nr:hypothetical protein [Verrucomicrobiota bacterium]